MPITCALEVDQENDFGVAQPWHRPMTTVASSPAPILAGASTHQRVRVHELSASALFVSTFAPAHAATRETSIGSKSLVMNPGEYVMIFAAT